MAEAYREFLAHVGVDLPERCPKCRANLGESGSILFKIVRGEPDLEHPEAVRCGKCGWKGLIIERHP